MAFRMEIVKEKIKYINIKTTKHNVVWTRILGEFRGRIEENASKERKF